jgi:hypothetical protein
MKRRWACLSTILVLLISLSITTLPNSTVRASPGLIYVDADASGSNDGTSWADAHNCLRDALDAAVAGDEIWVAEGVYRPDEDTAHPDGTDNRSATFQLIDGVALYGGFAGGETTLEQRNWETNQTILSGDLAGDDGPGFTNNDENSYHVVTGSGVGSTTVLDGFVITAGNADGLSLPIYCYVGGGMYNTDSTPTLTNCTFSGNLAGTEGGGMHNTGSSPSLTDCTFSGNLAQRGGAVYNTGSSPTLTNCTFSGNLVGSDGGAMYNHIDSNPSLSNCTFSSNQAVWNGGGMYNTASSPNLSNCTFSSNQASWWAGGGMYNLGGTPTLTNCTFTGNLGNTFGGGMYNDYTSPTLTNCTFSGNDSDGMYNLYSSPSLTNCTFSSNLGNGIYNLYSSPDLTNCTFSSNQASTEGGGMYNNDSSPTLTNCTFSSNLGGGMRNAGGSPKLINCAFTANQAESGGGMSNNRSSPSLTNCTFSGNLGYDDGGGMSNYYSSPGLTNCAFSGNQAGSDGGGLYNYIDSSPSLTNCTFSSNQAAWNGGGMYNKGSSPTLTNCILWGNSHIGGTDESAQICMESGSVAVHYSCIQGWTGALGGTGNIGDDPALLDANGPDGAPGTEDDDLRLSPGSPCVDTGDNTALSVDVTIDLDGDPRISDGDNDGVATVDMGAYELGRAPDQPSNVSPSNGATGVALTPILQSSVFSDPDGADTHASSQWQIRTSTGSYSVSVFDSTSITSLTEITIPSGILSNNTTYYWHVRHQDSYAVWSGWSAETGFTTLPLVSPPSVTTNAATSIGTSSATLNGDLTSLGTADNVWVCFEWGLTDSYGSTTTLQGPMWTPGTWSYPLSGLAPGTTYHFRAKADGGDGIAYGSDMTFTTGQVPEVEDVDPDTGKRNRDLTVTISGIHLDGTTAVSFGSGITVTDFTVNSSTEITADITIAADAAKGDRDVSVTTEWGTGTKPDAFEVVGGGGGICGAGAPTTPNQGSEMATVLAALGLVFVIGFLLLRKCAKTTRVAFWSWRTARCHEEL